MSPDYIIIPLNHEQETVVDSDDSDLANLTWFAKKSRNTFYAIHTNYVNKKNKTIRLHCLIMERVLDRPLRAGEQVDHKDGNGLNNHRDNLRLSNHVTNGRNKRRPSNNTSGYKGVRWHKKQGKWETLITIERKQKHIGFYETALDAGIAYNHAAKELFKEFAYFNDIDGWENIIPIKAKRKVAISKEELG